MATFAELVADVKLLTKRNDLDAETKMAVKKATLKMHQSDYYYKDLLQTGLQFPSANFLQQIDYRTLFPRYRSLSYIRKYDPVGDVEGIFFEEISPQNVLDDYSVNRDNVVYAAGAYLYLRSSEAFTNVLFGCYLNPDITETGYNSWIALDHPYAIIDEAASTLFKTIGYDEQAATYQRLSLEHLTLLRNSNIIAKGY
jgi:hypothetical protein